MVTGIVNSTATNHEKRDFLKAWVNSILVGRSSGTLSVPGRPDVLDFLIDPGFGKQDQLQPMDYSLNWQSKWDAQDEQDILDYAPFKLTAIVNRMDFRGNAAYNPGFNMAGETRFIFTLVSPLTNLTDRQHQLTLNTVPLQEFNFDSNPTAGPQMLPDQLDWKGMNIIFEYGNPQTNLCDTKDFAQSWLDLSASTYNPTDDVPSLSTPPDEDYNFALQQITETVVQAGAGGTGKINGSALNRIRTNEKIFFPSLLGGGNLPLQSWLDANWQLSQYELQSNGTASKLAAVPVTNTPQVDANSFTNISPFMSLSLTTSNTNAVWALRNWVYENQWDVQNGNFNIPNTYTSSGKTFNQALTADITNEQGHFWDWDWTSTHAGAYPGLNNITSTADQQLARLLRQQLSLNTCQGCHSGENKTMFTHVRPVSYGQSENYWDITTPASDQGTVDTRFINNAGRSKVNGTLKDVYPMLSTSGTSSTKSTGLGRVEAGYYQRVSAFLTGRKYNGPGDWQDDNTADLFDNSNDNLLDVPLTSPSPISLYYVYDPADNHNGTVDLTKPNPDQINGYNDLQRRKEILCRFLARSCNSGSVVVFILMETSNIPIGID